MTKEIFISGDNREQDNYSLSNNDVFTNPEEEFELPIDIARKGSYLIIKAPIVGALPTDISLTINNDVITIQKNATPDVDKFDNYYTQECHWGIVRRELHLPLKADPTKAEANLQDGVLRITLPIIGQPGNRSIKIS